MRTREELFQLARRLAEVTPHDDSAESYWMRQATEELDAASRGHSLWVVSREGARGQEVIYCLGTSAQDVWSKIEEDELMGSGAMRAGLRRDGWRARRCRLVVEEN